jgi:leucyl-tRNA synthetase
MDKPYSIHTQPWLSVDETSNKEDTIELPVQIKGNVCDRFTIRAKTTEDEIKSATLASETVQKFLGGKELEKVFVANR